MLHDAPADSNAYVRLYEQSVTSPTVFAAHHEDQKFVVARMAWQIHLDSEGTDSDALDVLRLCWQVLRCRSWIQDRQTDLFWSREQRDTFTQLMAPELHWRQQGEDVGAEPSNHGVVLSCATARVPQWLLEPWLRRGKLHSLEGKKGVGKSQLCLWLAKQIFARESDGKVLIFSREDDLGEDILPRAMALGVDLDRLVIYQDGITFGDTTEICARAQHHGAVLMVFDTLQKYISDARADMNSAFVAQGQIGPLEAIVNKTNCAALVVRHTRKGKVDDAAEAGLGSQGIAGAMRAILTAGKLDTEGEYGLSLAVGNYAAGGGGMVYRLTPTQVRVSDGMAHTTHVDVLRDDPTLSADKLTSGTQSDEDRGALAEAVEFLQGYLGDGPALKRDVLKAARSEGISEKTLRRARETLKVESRPFEQLGVPRNRWPHAWHLPGVQGCPRGELGNPGQPNDTRINTSDARVAQGCPTTDIEQVGQPKISQQETHINAQPPEGESVEKTVDCQHTRKRRQTAQNGLLEVWFCPDCHAVRGGGKSRWRPAPTEVCYHQDRRLIHEGELSSWKCNACGALLTGSIGKPDHMWYGPDRKASALLDHADALATQAREAAIG